MVVLSSTDLNAQITIERKRNYHPSLLPTNSSILERFIDKEFRETIDISNNDFQRTYPITAGIHLIEVKEKNQFFPKNESIRISIIPNEHVLINCGYKYDKDSFPITLFVETFLAAVFCCFGLSSLLFCHTLFLNVESH
jgi:hypothetical protein